MAQLLEHVVFWTPKAVRFFSRQEALSVKSVRISGIPFPLGGRPVEMEAQCVGGLLGIVGERGIEAVATSNQSMEIRMRREQRIQQKVQELLSKDGGQNTFASMARRFVNWLRLGDHVEVIMIKK